MKNKNKIIKGRGVATSIHNRYAAWERESVDDGWPPDEDGDGAPRTELLLDPSRSVVTYNQSPDVPFDRSINPYRGCEHGCVYCYARPTHAWLDLSPGIDFETKIFYKPDAARLLRAELSRPGYRCRPIGLGTNTDPWQLAERRLGVTRAILEVLREFEHPLTIVTKSTGIERDIDVLSDMASRDLVLVYVSICTLDAELSRRMEPRAAAPTRKLRAIERLAGAGVPVGVLVAPVIPVLNDAEIETILERAYEAGARFAHYTLLRLPLEVSPLFREWLDLHYPMKKQHVMNRVNDVHGGKDNRAEFGLRMRGAGVYADLVRQRFDRRRARCGYRPDPELDASRFRVPGRAMQLEMF